MSSDEQDIFLQMSPELKQALDTLLRSGLDIITAIRQIATTRPELFMTPSDEIVKMLATWD